MNFRTCTQITHKLAHLYGGATHSLCLLCHHPDSSIHILSGCQNVSIQNMVIENHSIASRLTTKTLSKGEFGGKITLFALHINTFICSKNNAQAEG